MLKNQSSLSSAGTPRQLAAGIMLEQRAPGQYPSAANRWLTASVCFITDTNDCSGNTFGDGEGYPNKPNPIDPIQPVPDEDKCSELGFKKTSCSEGYSPSGFCSYNSAYFKECVCSEACPDGYQDYPCGSGMLQADTVTPNCKTCYKCTACEDECPSGHTTESGSCRQASSYVTECGNKCYKVLDNSCKSGQLSAPAESGGYKNKIVSYTDCGNPCFQSYNDNCDTGYVKTKESGKCYETTAKYTDYGTACYKEKACCTPTCSSPWSLSRPSGDYIRQSSNCSGTYCYRTCDNTCSFPWSFTKPSGNFVTSSNDCKNTCYRTCQNTCEGGSLGTNSSQYNWQNDCGNWCTKPCPAEYKYTCSASGEKGSGTACNKLYSACSCWSGKKWYNGKCVPDVWDIPIKDSCELKGPYVLYPNEPDKRYYQYRNSCHYCKSNAVKSEYAPNLEVKDPSQLTQSMIDEYLAKANSAWNKNCSSASGCITQAECDAVQ